MTKEKAILAAVFAMTVSACDEAAVSTAAASGESVVPERADPALPSLQQAQSGPSGSVEIRIAEALRCDKRPAPTPILISLAEAGVIDTKANIGGDGISCFELTRMLNLPPSKGGEALPVSLICAYDEDWPETTAGTAYADVYYRGPGTSLGHVIAVFTPAEPLNADRWVRANDGRADSRVRNWNDSFMTFSEVDRPLTQVSCSNPSGAE